MRTTTKRGIAAGSSLAIVALIVAGAFGVAGAVTPEPVPTETFDVVEISSDEIIAPAEAVELAAAEAAAAAQAEADRLAAEKAAADAAAAQAAADAQAAEAARQAAEADRPEASTPNVEQQSSQPEAPAPAPAPVRCPSGTTAGAVDAAGNESMCQTPCSEWIDTDNDGIAETCGRP